MHNMPLDETPLDGATARAGIGADAPRKRPYSRPVLERLGDIRDITLGGSPGIGDSGNNDPHDPLGMDSGSLMDRPAPGGTPGANP